MVCWN